MKNTFIVFFLMSSSVAFSQSTLNTIAVAPPVYDTTSIDISSTNSFYFCNKLFKLPRDCEGKDQSNCCSFRSQVSNDRRVVSGQISCNNGASFFWNYVSTEEMAKSTFESMPAQYKKQMKELSYKPKKMIVCGIEVNAYQMNGQPLQGERFSLIVFYGAINGKHVFGRLQGEKQFNKTNELPPLFQQIVSL